MSPQTGTLSAPLYLKMVGAHTPRQLPPPRRAERESTVPYSNRKKSVDSSRVKVLPPHRVGTPRACPARELKRSYRSAGGVRAAQKSLRQAHPSPQASLRRARALISLDLRVLVSLVAVLMVLPVLGQDDAHVVQLIPEAVRHPLSAWEGLAPAPPIEVV